MKLEFGDSAIIRTLWVCRQLKLPKATKKRPQGRSETKSYSHFTIEKRIILC